MKSLFILIDNLMILLKYLPSSLRNKSDIKKAERAIKLIRDYTYTIKGIIINHQNEEHLKKLQSAHIKEINNWAGQITATFNKLDSLLNVLYNDTNKLERIIKEKKYYRWQSAISDMALGMFNTGLHSCEEDIERLKSLAVLEEKELNEIIENKRHLAELKSVPKIDELAYEEMLIAQEEYFIRLLGGY